jgi:hypothetical protein
MELNDSEIDARLRDAFSAEMPDASGIQRTVRKRIAAERIRRLTLIGIAASLLLVAGGYGLLKRTRGMNVYTELARDHHMEVVEQQPRHWRSGSAEIQSLIARYGVTAPMLAGFAPAGYVLQHAKSCGIAGMPVLHLVYSNGSRQLSVYVRQHVGSGIQPGSMTVDSEQVATFQRGGLEGAVVMVGSGAECAVMARRAASFL